jgi:hypothetical protein
MQASTRIVVIQNDEKEQVKSELNLGGILQQQATMNYFL